MLAWLAIGLANLLASIIAFFAGFSAGLAQALETGEAPALLPPEVTLISTVLGLTWGLMLAYFTGVMRVDLRAAAARLVESLRGRSGELQSSGDVTKAIIAGEIRRVAEELSSSVRISNPWPLPTAIGVLLLLITGASVYITPLSQEVAADPLAAIEILIFLAAISLIVAVAALAYIILLIYTLHMVNRHIGHIDRAINSSADALSRISPLQAMVMGRRLGGRRTLLYIVLTLVTLGFFLLYWVWTLNSDLAECETRAANLHTHLTRV